MFASPARDEVYLACERAQFSLAAVLSSGDPLDDPHV